LFEAAASHKTSACRRAGNFSDVSRSQLLGTASVLSDPVGAWPTPGEQTADSIGPLDARRNTSPPAVCRLQHDRLFGQCKGSQDSRVATKICWNYIIINRI
jgi:hypothetical protein